MFQDLSNEEKEQKRIELSVFVRAAIKNLARNATRKITRQEFNLNLIPWYLIKEEILSKYAYSTDKYDIEKTFVVESDMRISIRDEQIEYLLSDLTTRELQVLVLRTIFGLKYNEIALKLGISPERARVYKSQGIKKCRDLMEGEMLKMERLSYDTIDAALSGDDIALYKLVKYYEPIIDRDVNRFAPWLSPEGKEDCRQEIFMGLINLIRGNFDVVL